MNKHDAYLIIKFLNTLREGKVRPSPRMKRTKFPTPKIESNPEQENILSESERINEPEPVKDKTPEKAAPVKDEPSLARIRISRRRLGRNLGRGRGSGGIGGGNIYIDS